MFFLADGSEGGTTVNVKAKLAKDKTRLTMNFLCQVPHKGTVEGTNFIRKLPNGRITGIWSGGKGPEGKKSIYYVRKNILF